MSCYWLGLSLDLVPHLESFVGFVVCGSSWGFSVRQKKRHTTIRKMAKQQRISSILTQRRLCFLGHLSRMLEETLPKQLLVSCDGGKQGD